MSKYGHRSHNWFEAIVNKMGGEEAGERFLRGELAVVEVARSWREQDGIIYFSVTSDSTTGEEWIKRLEGKGFCIDDYGKSVLRSPNFKSTSGVTTEIAVFKGALFEDKDRIISNIRAEAEKRKFEKPNAEVACLIREKFTDAEIEAMDLRWIVTMHEPIKDSDGVPELLGTRRGDGGPWLDTCYGIPDRGWRRENGFAFAVAQVSTQNFVSQG